MAFALVHWSHANFLPLPHAVDLAIFAILAVWTLGFPPLGSAVWGYFFARRIFASQRKRQNG
jgi:hypothetical protein